MFTVFHKGCTRRSNSEDFLELTVLQENYAMLCNTITDIDNLMKYFVVERIIAANEAEEITSSTLIKSEKVKKLLINVSGPLRAGDKNGFYVMLKIMKTCGIKATQNLANHILGRVSYDDIVGVDIADVSQEEQINSLLPCVC